MKIFAKAFVILICGIALVIVPILAIEIISLKEKTLMTVSSPTIALLPNDATNRGFDVDSITQSIGLFILYEPRGVTMNLILKDSSGNKLMDKNFNNLFANIVELNDDTYYVIEITNIGSDPIKIYDISIQEEPQIDNSGNLIYLASQWYVGVLYLLFLVGCVVSIVGGILIIKNMRKKNSSNSHAI